MRPSQTWERVFFNAFALCALNRRHAHQSVLGDQDRAEISRLLSNRTESPSEGYLRQTFPFMFPKLEAFAKKQGKELRSVETVEAFCLEEAKQMQATHKSG